jgi:hypothetical protein
MKVFLRNMSRKENNELTEEKNVNWTLSATIQDAKGMNGVRRMVYGPSRVTHAYHDADKQAIWFERDDLNIHILFGSSVSAMRFRQRVNEILTDECNNWRTRPSSIPNDCIPKHSRQASFLHRLRARRV